MRVGDPDQVVDRPDRVGMLLGGLELAGVEAGGDLGLGTAGLVAGRSRRCRTRWRSAGWRRRTPAWLRPRPAWPPRRSTAGAARRPRDPRDRAARPSLGGSVSPVILRVRRGIPRGPGRLDLGFGGGRSATSRRISAGRRSRRRRSGGGAGDGDGTASATGIVSGKS